jgi:hypothetical protein
MGLNPDHINRDGLDNRKRNLRPATHGENAFNKPKMKRRGISASNFKGVSLDGGAWRAQITKGGKTIWLGRFRNEEEAALAYDKAATDHVGEYARLNFPFQRGWRTAPMA